MDLTSTNMLFPGILMESNVTLTFIYETRTVTNLKTIILACAIFKSVSQTSHLFSIKMQIIRVLSRVTRFKWLLFLLSISHIWLGSPWANENASIKSAKAGRLMKNEPHYWACVLIGPTEASQIWEMPKRKSSHLNLVTRDNTGKNVEHHLHLSGQLIGLL